MPFARMPYDSMLLSDFFFLIKLTTQFHLMIHFIQVISSYLFGSMQIIKVE